MDKKIAVLASGATGSSIGGFLSKAGYNVVLIDQWAAHVEAMNAQGLRINMTQTGELLKIPVKAIHLCDVCSLNQQFDIVFLTPKSYDSCWLTEFIKPYLKPDGVLVPVQNSLNPEWVAPIIGYERTIGCVIEQATELYIPGEIIRHSPPSGRTFMVGELNGMVTPRVKEVSEILNSVGLTVVTTNLWGGLWTKLILATSMAMIALAGCQYAQETTEDPQILRLAIKQAKEALHVGKVLGYTLEDLFGTGDEFFKDSEDELLEKAYRLMSAHVGPKQSNVVIMDFRKGRPSETDYMNGLVVRKGRQANVPTPINELVNSIVKEIEEGKRKPERSNLELMEPYM